MEKLTRSTLMTSYGLNERQVEWAIGVTEEASGIELEGLADDNELLIWTTEFEGFLAPAALIGRQVDSGVVLDAVPDRDGHRVQVKTASGEKKWIFLPTSGLTLI